MSFSGNFSCINSVKLAGMRIFSFSLKCTNWIQSETIDFMLSDAQNIKPWFFRNRKIKAGSGIIFNYDTCGWQWHQGDYFAILGKNGKIAQSWQLRLKEYAYGEDTFTKHQRPLIEIQQDIDNIKAQIEREEDTFRQNKLTGIYDNNIMLFQAQNDLIYTYKCQLIALQSELREALR